MFNIIKKSTDYGLKQTITYKQIVQFLEHFKVRFSVKGGINPMEIKPI